RKVSGLRLFVQNMNRKAVDAFVGQGELLRTEGALEAVPRGFGLAGRIDHAPPGSGQKVLEHPDKPAEAGASRTPPFGKGRFHYFRRDGAGKVEILFRILASQPRRIVTV